MTPNHLAGCGAALFGEYWRQSFRDQFGISAHTLRRMLTGKIPVPDGLASEIETALRDRGNVLDEALARFEGETTDAKQ